jgi:hypothetical protein
VQVFFGAVRFQFVFSVLEPFVFWISQALVCREPPVGSAAVGLLLVVLLLAVMAVMAVLLLVRLS